MISLVPWATTTALVAMREASAARLAISRMLAPISSVPPATVWMLALTCSEAADTEVACREVSSELELIWRLTELSSSEEAASVWALAAIDRKASPRLETAPLVAVAIWASSSVPTASMRLVRSPSATRWSTPRASPMGWTMQRAMKTLTSSARPPPSATSSQTTTRPRWWLWSTSLLVASATASLLATSASISSPMLRMSGSMALMARPRRGGSLAAAAAKNSGSRR